MPEFREKSSEEIKKVKPAEIEAKETYRKIKNTPAQTIRVKIKTKPKSGKIKLNELTAPKLVATPLPPLNFKKGVQLWPQTANRPARIMLLSPACGRTARSITAGKNPFKKSKINTSTPHWRPATRKTLVAPMLPEPHSRMSAPFTQRVIKNPNGTAPKK